MDETLRRSMLFDFYGELLTQKQREYFDLHYNEDLSLAEIAEQKGVSRQGVWDMIRRAQEAMEEIELRTGLIERLLKRREAAREILQGLETLRKTCPRGAQKTIDEIAEKLTGLTEI